MHSADCAFDRKRAFVKRRAGPTEEEPSMSLISFIKEVGAKLHGASEDKPAAPEILKQEVAKQGLPADKIDART